MKVEYVQTPTTRHMWLTLSNQDKFNITITISHY